MKLFNWLWRPVQPGNAALASRLAALPAAPQALAADVTLRQQRWVVVDVETTGLSLARDHVLSIGAVAIEDGAVTPSRSFARTLARTHKPGPSVLLHGLGPGALAAGCAPEQALLEFLEFTGSSPLLAFHAAFDQHMLARAMKQSLGYRWQAPFLDVAELAPLLLPDGPRQGAGLDEWIAHLRLEINERHHAVADAQVTAEAAMMLFSHARRQGLDTPQALQQRLGQWRRRQATHRL